MTPAWVALLLGALQVAEPGEAAFLRARQEAFLEAWKAAGEARRDAALRELDRLAPQGAPAGAPASARALGRAWRALVRSRAEPDASGTALEILAESLDLRAVPGTFSAASPGEPLTVNVRAPEGLRPAGRLELELRWIAPPGAPREELSARTSEAWPDAFTPRGFELYVRAPDGAAPGTWRLQLEIVDGARRAFVPPVSVECLAPGAIGPGEGARQRGLRRELEAWRTSGAPATEGLDAAALLDERGGRFVPLQAQDGESWAWRPEAELRGVAVVLSPAREAALAPLCGVRGAAWREIALAAGLLLVPWSASRRGAQDVLAGLDASLEGLEAGLERMPRVVYARADAAAQLALSPQDEPRFDAWALTWSAERAPRLPWPRTPACVLQASAPESGEALLPATPLHVARRGTGQVLLDDLLAPQVVLELAQAAQRGESRAR